MKPLKLSFFFTLCGGNATWIKKGPFRKPNGFLKSVQWPKYKMSISNASKWHCFSKNELSKKTCLFGFSSPSLTFALSVIIGNLTFSSRLLDEGWGEVSSHGLLKWFFYFHKKYIEIGSQIIFSIDLNISKIPRGNN